MTQRQIRNPFRNPSMRLHFDSVIQQWQTKHPNLFHKDGSRNTGNGMAGNFWRGYDGTRIGAGFTDRASRDTLAYVFWRAGELARLSEQQ